MTILTLKTDAPIAQLALFDDDEQIKDLEWQAGRELSDTIHHKLEELLKSSNKKLQDIEGIVCFKGPGSFTGLRIGLSVANAFAQSLDIPIVAANGPNWQKVGVENLRLGQDEKVVLPEYGTPAHITQPKK